jgi:hypothetical protein
MNITRGSSLKTIKESVASKLALASASLMMVAVIGASGVAAAAPTTKPTKAACTKAGFTNYGQCVKEWAHGKNRGGGGYGGMNTTIHTNISNNNQKGGTFSVIINYIFGS